MINLKNFNGFLLDKNDHSPEAKQLSVYCLVNDIEIKRSYSKDTIIHNHVPCGSVEFCEKILGYRPTPDYYPEWLSGYLHRKVWKSNGWILGERYFVKPADRFKRFDGFITRGTYSKKKKPPFWYSEITRFVNEWRYYISNGINLGGWWYQGKNEDLHAPDLQIKIKEGFCGTLDFGSTTHGKLALVEVHPPYACGWYGSQQESEIYFQWLIDGWEFMNR